MKKAERDKLKHVLELRMKQRKTLYDGFILPLDENIKLLRQVLRGERSTQEYLHHSAAITKLLKGLAGVPDKYIKGNMPKRRNEP